MQRFYALDLKDDPALIAGYEAWHQPGEVPPHVLAVIAASGIRAMRIFRTGNRLVMVTTVDDSVAAVSLPATGAQAQEWEALMDTFQSPLPWAEPGQKWVPMDCIFDSDLHQPFIIDESEHS